MNPRIRELLGEVNRSAHQQIGRLMAATRVHDFDGPHALRLIVETGPLGEHGNRYEIRVYPAIAVVEAVPGCSDLQFAFVVFSPTGELKRRRDTIERTREAGMPNTAFIEMCADLAPFTHELTAILDELTSDLEQLWPHRKLTFTAMATSAELDLVAAFVDVDSFRQVVLEVGRLAVAS